MDARQIERLLSRLGCRRIRVKHEKGWVDSECPLARWTHSGGMDEHPSFGVAMAPGGESHYHCMACGRSGRMVDLLWLLESLTGTSYSHLQKLVTGVSLDLLKARPESARKASLTEMKDLAQRANYSPDPPRVVAGLAISSQEPRPAWEHSSDLVLSEETLKPLYPLSPEAQAWLVSKRLLTERTIGMWELGWHGPSRRVAIPVRDLQGRLVCITGRSLNGATPKFMHSKGFKRDHYLFGEHFIPQQGLKTGYIVEGHFDVMYLHQCGFPALGIMGSYPSAMQIEKLIRKLGSAVIVPDGDKAGFEAAERLMRALTGRIPVRMVQTPEGKDPDELGEDGLRALLSS